MRKEMYVAYKATLKYIWICSSWLPSDAHTILSTTLTLFCL